jgi:hypothetical protein
MIRYFSELNDSRKGMITGQIVRRCTMYIEKPIGVRKM